MKLEAPQALLEEALLLALETGEPVWISEAPPLHYGSPARFRIVRQSELSPITIHCAQTEVRP